MTFPRMMSALLMGLGVVASFAAEAGLPDGVTLPAGMSVEQAKATAQSQGITTRAQAEAAAREQGVAVPGTGVAAPKGPKVVTDDGGDIDPAEGDVAGSDQSKPGDIVATGPGGGSDQKGLRYGQSIFRKANPSLFASHVGAVGSGYQLGAGDEIILTLWGQKEARYELTLDRSGQVSIEGVGLVSLNGLSLKDAQGLLQKRLMRIYAGMGSGQTSMDLTLGKLRQIRIFVNGDVVAPGSYMLSGNTNVFNALYQAKGPTNLGSERKIEIVRGSNRFEVDLYGYLFKGVRQARDILQDGDIVRVPVRGPVVSIMGDVGRPGTYELLPSESTKDLFVYCGGVTSTTAGQQVVASRVFDDGRRDAVTLPNARALASGTSKADLKDGDQLFVYQGKDPSKLTVTVSGEVRFPGGYPWKSGMTVADLVKDAGGYGSGILLDRAFVSRKLMDGSSALFRITVDPVSTFVLQASDAVEFLNRFSLTFKRDVVLSGAVVRPGKYALDSGMTVKDLILKAGGFLKEAEFGRVRIEWPLDSSRGARVQDLMLDSNLSSGAADFALEDGLHVAVPFLPTPKVLSIVEVSGQVQRPGAYSMLNARERISSVLSRAGGLKPEAYPRGGRLVRLGTGRIAIDLGKAISEPGGYDDIELRTGDRIEIPLTPATVSVSGRVFNPGNIPWKRGKDWKWYISMAGGMSDSADNGRIYLKLADGSMQSRDYGIDSLPSPGAEIVVPFKAPSEPIKFTDIITAVGSVATILLTAVTIFILVDKS